MTSLIALPENFTTLMLGNMTTLFADFAPYILVIISILATALLMEIFIGALRK